MGSGSTRCRPSRSACGRAAEKAVYGQTTDGADVTNGARDGASYDVSPGVPHVWLVDVGSPTFLELGRRPNLVTDGLVSEEDDQRASSFLDSEAGDRLRARRVILRMILGRYLACAPTDVGVVTAPGGKPVLLPGTAGAATHAFSVGHSGDLYAIAVGRCSSLGLDIERLRSVGRATSIAERWFGPEEASSLQSLTGEALDLAFMELWTDKEALAKRHGAGLRLMHGQADVPEVHSELDVGRERAAARLLRIHPGSGYVGAIASSEPLAGVDLVNEGDPRWII